VLFSLFPLSVAVWFGTLWIVVFPVPIYDATIPYVVQLMEEDTAVMLSIACGVAVISIIVEDTKTTLQAVLLVVVAWIGTYYSFLFLSHAGGYPSSDLLNFVIYATIFLAIAYGLGVIFLIAQDVEASLQAMYEKRNLVKQLDDLSNARIAGQHSHIDSQLAEQQREIHRIGALTIAATDEATAAYVYTIEQVVSAVNTVNQLLANTDGLTELQKARLNAHLQSYLARIEQCNQTGRIAMLLQLEEYANELQGGGTGDNR
jgi:hypothetical protein